MSSLKQFLCSFLMISLSIFPALSYAAGDGVVVTDKLGKMPGMNGEVYFSNPSKTKILVKTNFWGGVKKPGIHYVPENTDLLTAMSVTGGPVEDANLDEIEITRATGQVLNVDLEDNENMQNARNIKLKSGDVVNVPVSSFYRRTPFWLSMVTAVIAIGSFAIVLDRD